MKLKNFKTPVLTSFLLSILCYFSISCQPKPATPLITKSIKPSSLTVNITGKVQTLQSTLTPTASKNFLSHTASPAPDNMSSSPLEGVDLKDLPSYITNKFSPPPPSSDKPHQGVDFSITNRQNNQAIGGDPVQAVLDGVVAAVILDRFPYGNAILVETNLESVSPTLKNSIILPTPAPIQLSHPVLTCPTIDIGYLTNPQDYSDITGRSLYLLYAHLDGTVQLQPDDNISSGQTVGKIGSSGNALNPHLHLELRVGPSGFRIPSMAHYDPSASVEEMGYYCIWRISNLFQLLDPMILFND